MLHLQLPAWAFFPDVTLINKNTAVFPDIAFGHPSYTGPETSEFV